MLTSLKTKFPVPSGAASPIPGGGERLGKDTCRSRPLIVAVTRRTHALD
jgi:hypothetical protein